MFLLQLIRPRFDAVGCQHGRSVQPWALAVLNMLAGDEHGSAATPAGTGLAAAAAMILIVAFYLETAYRWSWTVCGTDACGVK